MAKPRGAICNLDCEYCYYLQKEELYPDSNFRMSDSMLRNYVRQYIEAQRVPEVTFAWQGGEPTLMGLAFFQKALDYQKEYGRPGMRINNVMQTNGTKLDEEWCAFFEEHDFLIGISIDGPREQHDAYRHDKGGASSFDRVMRGLDLLKEHSVDYNILCAVNAANQRFPLEVYRFFRDVVGAEFIQFIPIVERDNETGYQEGNSVTARSVTAEGYGKFLIDVFDEWVQRDVGRVFVQIFDVSLGAWMGKPGGLCVFAPTCGTALVMEHNGDLYSCDHYVEPDYLLGNIGDEHMLTLVSSDRQQKFGRDKFDTLPRYCRECEVRFACHGGCPKNRLLDTPDGELGLNYLCVGYRAFFNHVARPMQFMADELRRRQAL